MPCMRQQGVEDVHFLVRQINTDLFNNIGFRVKGMKICIGWSTQIFGIWGHLKKFQDERHIYRKC